jgi:hypothetical protein
MEETEQIELSGPELELLQQHNGKITRNEMARLSQKTSLENVRRMLETDRFFNIINEDTGESTGGVFDPTDIERLLDMNATVDQIFVLYDDIIHNNIHDHEEQLQRIIDAITDCFEDGVEFENGERLFDRLNLQLTQDQNSEPQPAPDAHHHDHDESPSPTPGQVVVTGSPGGAFKRVTPCKPNGGSSR